MEFCVFQKKLSILISFLNKKVISIFMDHLNEMDYNLQKRTLLCKFYVFKTKIGNIKKSEIVSNRLK